MGACEYRGFINNKPIQLYENILKISNNRELAKQVLAYSQNEVKIEYPDHPKDSQGMPTLDFIMRTWQNGWKKRIDFNSGNVRKAVADYSGFTNKIVDHTEFTVLDNNTKNWEILQQKALEFNASNPFRYFYKARVGVGGNNRINGIKVNLDYITETPTLYSIDTKTKTYNEKLNSRLRDILKDAGVSIGALNTLDIKSNASGTFDSSNIGNTVDGLIECIRLANDINGEKALPEEFAHFAVEALIDNKLIQRGLQYIVDTKEYVNILGDSLDKYTNLYGGNEELLAKEALGKIIANKLENSIPTSLFERIINAIKLFFNTLKIKKVDSKIIDFQNSLDKELDSFASDLLSNKFKNKLRVENIKNKVQLNSINEELTHYDKVLDGVIQNEIKKFKVFSQRNYKFDSKQKDIIHSMQISLDNKESILGITNYLKKATSDLYDVQKRFDDITKNYTSKNILEVAKTLRMMKDYTDSYQDTLNLLQGAINHARMEDDKDFLEATQDNIAKLNSLVAQTEKAYNDIILPLFAEFASKFVNEKTLTNPFKKDENGNYYKTTLEEILKESKDGDIGFLDRWFSSLSNSNEASLRLFDRIIKDSHENKRLRVIDFKKKAEAAHIELEQAGNKDGRFIYELDDNGIPTGNYISELKYFKFKENLEKAQKENKEKVKDLDPIQQSVEYRKLMSNWYDTNMEIKNGKKIPKFSIYENKTYTNLSESQLKYLNFITSSKEELDNFLPDKYKQHNKVPIIRKDELERFKTSPKDTIIEGAKDKILRREDDDDFGIANTITDFSGKEVKVIPIYFTSMLDNMKDLSLDGTSALIAYADMAINFNEMDKVVDMLELGKNVINNKEVVSKKGNKIQQENIRSFGKDFKRVLTKKGENTNIGAKLEGYFDAQIYGKYKIDQGTFGNTKIDKAKTMDTLSGMTATYSLGLNVLQGIGNVITGKTLAGIEALAGQFINYKNLTRGDFYYGSGLLDLLGETGKRVKTSKLNLFIEKFDCLNDSNAKNRDINMDKKTWLARGLKLESLQFMSTCGEHYMQTRTYLALADRIKMKAPDGTECSLYEALEPIYIDKDNTNKGATLEIKEGYTKLDGSKFTEEDVKNLTLKGREINNRLHGLHNKADLAEIQRYAEGRMIMLFRKWIPVAISQRYGSAQYNYALDEWTEGYYRTAGRFLVQTAKDLRKLNFYTKANWDKLNPTEKANIKRAAVEMGVFLASALAVSLIDFGSGADRPWLVKMLEYQLFRINNEMAFYTPTPAAITQGLQLVQSPTANIGYAQKMLKLISLKSFQSGQDGTNNGEKWLLQTIPTFRSIEGALNPSSRVQFYKH